MPKNFRAKAKKHLKNKTWSTKRTPGGIEVTQRKKNGKINVITYIPGGGNYKIIQELLREKVSGEKPNMDQEFINQWEKTKKLSKGRKIGKADIIPPEHIPNINSKLKEQYFEWVNNAGFEFINGRTEEKIISRPVRPGREVVWEPEKKVVLKAGAPKHKKSKKEKVVLKPTKLKEKIKDLILKRKEEEPNVTWEVKSPRFRGKIDPRIPGITLKKQRIMTPSVWRHPILWIKHKWRNR